jgi:hypothetical protein
VTPRLDYPAPRTDAGVDDEMELVLQTAPEAIEWLAQLRVSHHILETRAAAQIYNTLARQGVAVGGLFHSTC